MLDLQARLLIEVHLTVNVGAVLADEQAKLHKKMRRLLLLAVNAVLIEWIALHLLIEEILYLWVHRNIRALEKNIGRLLHLGIARLRSTLDQLRYFLLRDWWLLLWWLLGRGLLRWQRSIDYDGLGFEEVLLRFDLSFG